MKVAARRKRGFTLLELLSVMAIMVILMGITGAAYFGMGRGASLRGAVTNLRSTFSLARQFAATRRKRTYVLLWLDQHEVAWYQTFVEAGVDAGAAVDMLEVYGRELSGEDVSLEGGTIYNLSNLSADGYEEGRITSDRWDSGSRMSVVETTGIDQWQNGDVAGWAIRSKGRLPEGIRYDFAQEEIIFNPDGTSQNSADINIGLSETMGGAERTVTVRAFTGLVEVN